MQTADKWYEHDPKTMEEKDDIIIFYDMPIHIDREISANHLDIVIKINRDNEPFRKSGLIATGRTL